jgi:hypothetical protein
VLNGPVVLHLWSAASGSATTFAYLYDCTAGGASCTQIAAGMVHSSTWFGWMQFTEHDVTIGTVHRVLPAGHELRLGLYVTQGDQWVAMTAAYPSSLTLTVP